MTVCVWNRYLAIEKKKPLTLVDQQLLTSVS